MDLKSILTTNKEKKESYWALLLEPGWVSVAIWEVIGEEINVVSQSIPMRFSKEDDLINVIDMALSSSVSSLPEDFQEPEKTVFGLPFSWIDEGNVKPEHLEQLKKVCESLSLVPSGFVVLSEAIAHFLKTNEGSPLSAVVVGVSEANFEISLFKLGKPAGTFNVSRSVNVADDLIEGLTRFGTDEVFPSRVVIYDGKEADLEDIRNVLSETSWEEVEKVKFLHTPKIDVINPQEKIVAVCLAGGAELAGVTKVMNTEIPEDAGNVVEPKENLTATDIGFVVNEPEKVMKPKLPRINLPKPKMKLPKTSSKNPMIIGGFALATFLIAGFLFWWFYPTAQVTVFVSPKKLDEKMEIVLGSDFSSKEISVEVEGEKTMSTTGTKTVGEKAKGSVKIQNGTANNINLATGTILTSSSDLKFITEKSASISAALSPSSPGTATVEVAAYDIGPEYNLAKDEVFKIGNYPKSDVDAISVDDFSGGSSRQISAVSDDDTSSLEESLTKELLDEARVMMGEKVSLEEILIESSLVSQTNSIDFSNKEGDEASTLKLSLSLKVTGKVVSKADLVDHSTKLLEGKVPSGFVLRDDQVSYKFNLDDKDLNKFYVDVSVNLLPNINTSEIAKVVVGKYPNLAEQYLESVPGFVRAEFRVKPLFPGKLGTLPHVIKKIEVDISADR